MASESGQQFIDSILFEGTHYGWENYGNGAPAAFNSTEEAKLIKLAGEANKAALKLSYAEDAFLQEAEKQGYVIEDV